MGKLKYVAICFAESYGLSTIFIMGQWGNGGKLLIDQQEGQDISAKLLQLTVSFLSSCAYLLLRGMGPL